MKINPIFLALCGALITASINRRAEAAEPVTVENFPRAESDLYMGNSVRDGGFGKFAHHRTPTDIEHQAVIRMNRDTLYSSAVFDLDAGPVTVTLPDAGRRFMSLQVISEDHYATTVIYQPGKTVLTRENAGTRYVMAAVRTLVDPAKPDDLQQVHALQNAIRVVQAGGPGKFEVPDWDQTSQGKIREALLVLGASTNGFRNAFGSREQVDPIAHLIGTAMGWGGNPERDATYLGVTPERNDGGTVYRLTVGDVPVDGFWSVSVYNAKGFFEANPQNAYSVNNITARKGADGSVAIQFGGSGNDPSVNYLPVTPGWNYTVRLYRPRKEILDSSWKFPAAEVIKAAGQQPGR